MTQVLIKPNPYIKLASWAHLRGEMFTLLTKHETYSLMHISWSGWRSSRQNESILPAFGGCVRGRPSRTPHPAAERADLLSQKSKLRQQDAGELA